MSCMCMLFQSRSLVQLEVDCSRSKNVESNRPSLSHALDIDPQDTVVCSLEVINTFDHFPLVIDQKSMNCVTDL